MGVDCSRRLHFKNVRAALTVAATGTITGPEARGDIALIRADDGTRTVQISNFWVAPGAPDVRLYLSPHPDAVLTGAADLGHIPDDQTQFSRPVPSDVGADQIQSVVIYCKVYSVLFGSGHLIWN